MQTWVRISAWVLSVVQIGKVSYDLNTLVFNNIIVDTIYFNGINSTQTLDLVSELLDGERLLDYNGIERFEVPLPTALRAGAALKMSDMLTLAADISLPLSSTAQDFSSVQAGAGARLTLLRFLQLSGGLTAGGNYGSMCLPVLVWTSASGSLVYQPETYSCFSDRANQPFLTQSGYSDLRSDQRSRV